LHKLSNAEMAEKEKMRSHHLFMVFQLLAVSKDFLNY